VAEHATSRKEIVRRCAVTRQARQEHELLRFVADAEGSICVDLKRKLPGRGVWVTASKPIVAEAVRRKAFQRSLRRNVKATDDLAEAVEQALRRDVLNRLSLANKAGQVAVGFAKVGLAIDKGKAAAVLHADEAAPSGCQRLDRKFVASGRSAEARKAHVFRFSLDALSRALGRENLNHAAVLHGGAGASFIAAAVKLCHYTSDGKTSSHEPSRGETVAGDQQPARQDFE